MTALDTGSAWAALIGQHIRATKGPYNFDGVLVAAEDYGLLIELDAPGLLGRAVKIAHPQTVALLA